MRHADDVLRRHLATACGARAWARLLYAVLAGPLALLGALYLLVAGLVGALLAVTVVGLPALAAILLGARAGGAGHRRLVGVLLGVRVPPPPPSRPASGILGWVGATVTDGTNWRAVAYLAVKVPLGLAVSVATLTVWLGGGFAVAYPYWRTSSTYEDPAGRVHRGTVGIGGVLLDTAPRAAMVVVAGLLVLLAAPWMTRILLWPDGRLAPALLGPSRAARLRHARAALVNDAVARLRRIERDLHDGAQAQLVALAMNLGMAKEMLATGDTAAAASIVDGAHDRAKRAIVELRDLARGIHPASLDNGLGQALHTLAAANAVPVDVRLDLPHRPSPAIETIAYFTAAELLTNIAKHSRARRASVALSASRRGWLRMTVTDDGVVGARPGHGLTGLANRVGAVDGTMHIASPPGGPTIVTVELPRDP